MSAVLDGWFAVLTFATALGCGLVAGVFFTFSTFVMPALGRLPAPQGIAAMQSINVAAITPSFMAALFGTGLACAILIGGSLMDVVEVGWRLRCSGRLDLPRRHDPGNHRRQRAAKRCARGRGPGDCRGCDPVGFISHELDGVEPRPVSHGVCCSGVAHGRALPVARRGERLTNPTRCSPSNRPL